MTTILIVDSRQEDRQLYVALLSSFGYRTLEANDGAEALEVARAELPDLVITDMIMPNIDGFSLTRRLHAEPLLEGVPVIFQTVHYLEAEVRKLATATGIKHILGKPAEPSEILKAVNETLKKPVGQTNLPQTGELQREHLQLLADKLYQKNLELEQANDRLRTLSLTDELTGLNNRRGFMILANGLFKFARRAKHPLCLLYIDMDALKSINDTYGHSAGDSALMHFSQILTKTFRDSDVVARLGGDEFVILTVDATEGSLKVIRTRLQSNVETHNLEAARGYSLSFSLGIIRVDLDSTFAVEELLAQADKAMYAHKKKRKRKV